MRACAHGFCVKVATRRYTVDCRASARRVHEKPAKKIPSDVHLLHTCCCYQLSEHALWHVLSHTILYSPVTTNRDTEKTVRVRRVRPPRLTSDPCHAWARVSRHGRAPNVHASSLSPRKAGLLLRRFRDPPNVITPMACTAAASSSSLPLLLAALW